MKKIRCLSLADDFIESIGAPINGRKKHFAAGEEKIIDNIRCAVE